MCVCVFTKKVILDYLSLDHEDCAGVFCPVLLLLDDDGWLPCRSDKNIYPASATSQSF